MCRTRGKERTHFSGSAPLFQKLRQRQGDFTLNGAFILLFVAVVLILFISALGAVSTSMKLHSVTAELVRYVELRGRVDAQVYIELDRLANVAGVTVESFNIDATYFSGDKIQLGTPFSVTLTATGHLGIGGIMDADIPLTATVSGRSEQYWK